MNSYFKLFQGNQKTNICGKNFTVAEVLLLQSTAPTGPNLDNAILL